MSPSSALDPVHASSRRSPKSGLLSPAEPISAVRVGFLVGLVAFPALLQAFIAPLLFLSMALLEGQVLTPSIVGHRFTLNPLTVFLSLVFWA